MKVLQPDSLQTPLCGGQIRLMHIYPRNDQMHRHSFFELVYVVNGSATHHLGDERMRLQAGVKRIKSTHEGILELLGKSHPLLVIKLG